MPSASFSVAIASSLRHQRKAFSSRLCAVSLGPGLAGAAAVLSVLPAVYALVVVMRHVASLDELQRLIHLQAAAFSIGLTVVAGLTAGSLRAFAGLPPIELVWSVPVVAVGWMIGLGVASRRYA